MKERVYVQIKLYLYKQVMDWIWPTGSTLPTPDTEISLTSIAMVVLSFSV